MSMLHTYLPSCCEGVRQSVGGIEEFIRFKLVCDVECFSIYLSFVAAVHCSNAAKMPAQS